MNRAQPNERLAELMRSAGLSNKALARAVRELSVRRGAPLSTDHTAVSRWLSGMTPRPTTAALVVEVLGSKLGRTLSLRDVGFAIDSNIAPELGLTYPQSALESIETLATLWQSEIDPARIISDLTVNAGAWSEVPLAWLLRENSEMPIVPLDGASIGDFDVAAIRATTGAFSTLDNSFGGGHARRALIQYLQTDAAAMLKGRYSEETGKQLFDAVSEATLLAAWMSYDAGKHGLAQRYFTQALRLAHAAENPLLAGSILDAMSHQATFLGFGREAANLAKAARNGSRGQATSTLTAHFYAMEARALAITGDSSGANRALSEAVRVFEKRKIGSDPEWISYFDDVELSAEFSHCFRDLKRSDDAIMYAERGISGESPRSDFFVTMVLAAGHLGDGRGDVEQACASARVALKLGSQVRSARCVEYLRQFRRSLAPFAGHQAVIDLSEESRDHPLWEATEGLKR